MLYAAVAVFVATHVCLRTEIVKPSSSIRTKTATELAVFEGSQIPYNKGTWFNLMTRDLITYLITDMM